jgi:hypothetical protein
MVDNGTIHHVPLHPAGEIGHGGIVHLHGPESVKAETTFALWIAGIIGELRTSFGRQEFEN